jgi:glycosyltransferase involved in cell wall biosynthesis
MTELPITQQLVSHQRERVLRVALLASHDEPGGVLMIWDHLAEGLSARGLFVQRFALQHRGQTVQPGWPTLWPRAMRPWEIVSATRSLASVLRKGEYDVVVAALPLANIVASVAAWAAGVPSRITSHHSQVGTYARLQRLMDRLVGSTGAVTRVVCVSNEVCNSLRYYPARYRQKLVVIRNAITPDIAEAAHGLVREGRRDVINGATRLAAIGRLAPEKNFSVLLAALVLLPGTHLELVGDGPLRAQLQDEAVQLGVSNRVTFHGQLAHLDALRVVSEADIFVQPSHFEGRSIALLEAAAMGMPLLVSDAAGQIEAVTRSDGVVCAQVAAVSDPESYAALVASMIGRPGRLDELGLLARTIAAESSFDAMVDDYLRLIHHG